MKIDYMWYFRLKLASLPYGYWLDPQGVMHGVGEYAHDSKFEEWNLKGYTHAFAKGYIRIVNPRLDDQTFAVTLKIECMQVLPNQMAMLESLISECHRNARKAGHMLVVDIDCDASGRQKSAWDLKPYAAIQKLQSLIAGIPPNEQDFFVEIDK